MPQKGLTISLGLIIFLSACGNSSYPRNNNVQSICDAKCKMEFGDDSYEHDPFDNHCFCVVKQDVEMVLIEKSVLRFINVNLCSRF